MAWETTKKKMLAGLAERIEAQGGAVFHTAADGLEDFSGELRLAKLIGRRVHGDYFINLLVFKLKPAKEFLVSLF